MLGSLYLQKAELYDRYETMLASLQRPTPGRRQQARQSACPGGRGAQLPGSQDGGRRRSDRPHVRADHLLAGDHDGHGRTDHCPLQTVGECEWRTFCLQSLP